MACPGCDWKGYVEGSTFRDGGIKPTIEQCPRCRDTAAYSLAVQRRAELMEQALAVATKYEQRRRDLARPPCPVIELRPRRP